jgi:transcriptional regulator with XRE-family HTH domain
MGFAAMLQELREKAGLSQTGLAKKAGVPFRSVQNWEQGVRVPRPQALLALAEALGTTADELIRGMTGPKPKAKPHPRKRGGGA